MVSLALRICENSETLIQTAWNEIVPPSSLSPSALEIGRKSSIASQPALACPPAPRPPLSFSPSPTLPPQILRPPLAALSTPPPLPLPPPAHLAPPPLATHPSATPYEGLALPPFGNWPRYEMHNISGEPAFALSELVEAVASAPHRAGSPVFLATTTDCVSQYRRVGVNVPAAVTPVVSDGSARLQPSNKRLRNASSKQPRWTASEEEQLITLIKHYGSNGTLPPSALRHSPPPSNSATPTAVWDSTPDSSFHGPIYRITCHIHLRRQLGPHRRGPWHQTLCGRRTAAS